MSGHVWISEATMEARFIGKLETDIHTNDPQAAFKAEKLCKNGQPVPQNMCPTRVWGSDRAPFFKRMPHLVEAQCHWIVSAEAAEVLRQFNLGGGALYPITEGAFQQDNKTRVPGEIFTWIFGNTKIAFLEQHSPKAREMSGGSREWCKLPFVMEENDISVSKAALEGPDVWVDPLLFKSIFLSGPLGDALDAAGLRQAFGLFRCPVI